MYRTAWSLIAAFSLATCPWRAAPGSDTAPDDAAPSGGALVAARGEAEKEVEKGPVAREAQRPPAKEDPRKALPILDRGDGQEKRLGDVVAEGKDNLREIQRLLDEIEKDLASKATGEPTQRKQGQVVERMDELLKALESQCSKCSSGASKQPKDGASGKQQAREEKPKPGESKDQEPREAQKSQAQQPEGQDERDAEREKRQGQVSNDRADDEATPEAKAEALRRQLLELSRRWGVLPPKLREEALFSTGREAPPEYLEIISRYYRRLTEFYLESPDR